MLLCDGSDDRERCSGTGGRRFALRHVPRRQVAHGRHMPRNSNAISFGEVINKAHDPRASPLHVTCATVISQYYGLFT